MISTTLPETVHAQQKPKKDPVTIILRMHLLGDAPLTDTLHYVSHKIKEACRAEKAGADGAMLKVWKLVLVVACELPPSSLKEPQAKLVSFLHHFKHHANPDLPEDTWHNLDERGSFAYGPVDKDWASCRQAAMVLYGAAVGEVNIGVSENHVSQLVNFTAFLARMTEAGLLNLPPVVCSAMSAMGSGLQANITQANATLVSAITSGAAVWIIYASHRMFEMVQQGESSAATGGQNAAKYTIKSQDWAQWKEDLQQVQTKEE